MAEVEVVEHFLSRWFDASCVVGSTLRWFLDEAIKEIL